jgi:lysophospholipase L1-like esterase
VSGVLPDGSGNVDLSSVYAPRAGNTIVLLGDSITVLNAPVTGWALDGITTTTGYPAEGWFDQANILMRQRFNVIGYKGVGGQPSGLMLSRFQTDVVALSPAYVFIHAGINDFNNVYLEALSTYQANMKAMFAAAKAAGIKVIVSTIMSPQVDSIPQVDNATMRANRYAANQWLAAYCAANPEIILIDWTAAATNPDTGRSDNTNPDGVTVNFPLKAYSTDGVHPITYGAFQMAQVIAARLSPLVPDNTQLVGTNLDTTAGTSNPLMSGNSSGLATGWTAAQTFLGAGTGNAPVYTASKVTAFPSDVNGSVSSEWQQIALTSGDIEVKSPMTTLAASGFNVGDMVYAECEFQADSAGWAMNLFGCGFMSRTAGALQTASGANIPQTASIQPYMASGVMRSVPIPIANTSDRLQFLFFASGSGTFRIRKACVRKVATA